VYRQLKPCAASCRVRQRAGGDTQQKCHECRFEKVPESMPVWFHCAALSVKTETALVFFQTILESEIIFTKFSLTHKKISHTIPLWKSSAS
jgi:hypothetical protein